MNRLITIRFSHYNERARWALDRAEIPYAEEPHLPLFHFPAVFLATRGARGREDKVSTGYSTPLFITPEGLMLHDSRDILLFACEKSGEDLYPCSEVAEMEQRLHDRLGPHARRMTYFRIFDNPPLLPLLARRNVGALEASLFTLMMPLVKVMMLRLLKINRENADRSLRISREEFQWVGEVLGDKPYLLGDRFSAADLTFASLAAALLIPSAQEGYGANLFSRDELPEEARRISEELRETRAGRHAMRMYAQERGTRLVQCHPPLDPNQIY